MYILRPPWIPVGASLTQIIASRGSWALVPIGATCLDFYSAKYCFKKLINYDIIFVFLDQGWISSLWIEPKTYILGQIVHGQWWIPLCLFFLADRNNLLLINPRRHFCCFSTKLAYLLEMEPSVAYVPSWF